MFQRVYPTRMVLLRVALCAFLCLSFGLGVLVFETVGAVGDCDGSSKDGTKYCDANSDCAVTKCVTIPEYTCKNGQKGKAIAHKNVRKYGSCKTAAEYDPCEMCDYYWCAEYAIYQYEDDWNQCQNQYCTGEAGKTNACKPSG